MPQGGRLTIATTNVPSAGGDMICIALSDTGEGMPRDVVERAFEPFFTTKPVGKGTGLGLSQVHGFAAQSGGRAELESTPGSGTTVRIFLPRTHKAVADGQRGEPVPVARPGLRVLLVEDNPHVLVFAQHLLEDLQYHVVAADSGEQALEILDRGEGIDLLFADVVMPGLSGVELAESARRVHPNLPVVLATGYSDEILAGSGSSFEVLRKPYDPHSLGKAILAALDTMRQRQTA
jgi:CheY-like chemotaxis protein